MNQNEEHETVPRPNTKDLKRMKSRWKTDEYIFYIFIMLNRIYYLKHLSFRTLQYIMAMYCIAIMEKKDEFLSMLDGVYVCNMECMQCKKKKKQKMFIR